MSPLRQEAFQLLESTSEENLLELIHLMKEQSRRLSPEERLAEKQKAYEELQELIHSHKVEVPDDFDCKKELAQYREERYGNAHIG